jgi:hypothetical protein
VERPFPGTTQPLPIGFHAVDRIAEEYAPIELLPADAFVKIETLTSRPRHSEKPAQAPLLALAAKPVLGAPSLSPVGPFDDAFQGPRAAVNLPRLHLEPSGLTIGSRAGLIVKRARTTAVSATITAPAPDPKHLLVPLRRPTVDVPLSRVTQPASRTTIYPAWYALTVTPQTSQESAVLETIDQEPVPTAPLASVALQAPHLPQSAQSEPLPTSLAELPPETFRAPSVMTAQVEARLPHPQTKVFSAHRRVSSSAILPVNQPFKPAPTNVFLDLPEQRATHPLGRVQTIPRLQWPSSRMELRTFGPLLEDPGNQMAVELGATQAPIRPVPSLRVPAAHL